MTVSSFTIDLTELKNTKNMTVYEAKDGKNTIVPVYLSQAVLLEVFKHLPTSIRITVEATDT